MNLSKKLRGFYPDELLQKYIDEKKPLDDIMNLSLDYGIQRGFDYLIENGRIFDDTILSYIYVATNNVEELKKMDSKYYNRNSFLLYHACCGYVDNVDIVKFIAESNTKYDYSMEIYTAATGCLYDTTKYLLEHTYDINELDLDEEFYESKMDIKYYKIIKLLLEYKPYITDEIMYNALCENQYEIIKLFLDKGYIFRNFDYFYILFEDCDKKTLQLIKNNSTDEFKNIFQKRYSNI